MKRSLNFKKETVANLNSNELKQLQGGATFNGIDCIQSVDLCIKTIGCLPDSVKNHCFTRPVDCVSFHTEQNTCFNCHEM
ncbi:MAG: class I lanthipeptide [Hyphomicrobiales bacterium]